MIERHLGLVHHTIGKLSPAIRRRYEYDELVSLGCVGLAEGLESYDPSRGKLSSHVVPRIRGAILDAVRRDKGRGRRTFVAIESVELRDPAESVQKRLEREERDARLWSAVDGLKPKEAATLRGIFLYEQTLSEIAFRLAVSSPRVSQLKTSGLTMLKSRFQKVS